MSVANYVALSESHSLLACLILYPQQWVCYEDWTKEAMGNIPTALTAVTLSNDHHWHPYIAMADPPHTSHLNATPRAKLAESNRASSSSSAPYCFIVGMPHRMQWH